MAGSEAAQAQPFCISFSFTKRKVQDTKTWPYLAMMSKGSNSTTVPFFPYTQGFQPLKMYKQAVLSHPPSKAFGRLSHHMCEWPRRAAGRPSRAGFQHQGFAAPGSTPARAIMLEEHLTVITVCFGLGGF